MRQFWCRVYVGKEKRERNSHVTAAYNFFNLKIQLNNLRICTNVDSCKIFTEKVFFWSKFVKKKTKLGFLLEAKFENKIIN